MRRSFASAALASAVALQLGAAAPADSATEHAHASPSLQMSAAAETSAAAGMSAAAETAADPAARWRGRYCTTPSCSSAAGAGNPISGSAGFGACVLAAGWLSRRRAGQSR